MQQIYKLDKNGDGLLSLEEFKKSGAPEVGELASRARDKR